MKVIVAGYSKTGTKSICAALATLGYKTYDYVEHYWYHGDDWNKILTTGGTVEDFKRMYEDVDAVTDHPAFYFWEQIHEAFPDSKIIFTTRDNEDSWYKSLRRQIQSNNDDIVLSLITWIPILGRPYYKFFTSSLRVVFGLHVNPITARIVLNETVSRMAYRQHNDHVLKTAPKDKLLVYKVSEGWEPLCGFLGKEIPDKTFPWKNVNASGVAELVDENPIIIKLINRAKFISFALIAVITAFVLFYFF